MRLNTLLAEISKIWVQSKSEAFSKHPTANLIKNDLVDAVKQVIDEDNSRYLIKSSAGAGNWADVCWLAVLDPRITRTTQSGVYPVYLFAADGSGVFLSLGFGTTELTNQYGLVDAKQKAGELRKKLRAEDNRLQEWNTEIQLNSETKLGKSYEWATAGAKFYPASDIPKEEQLVADLRLLLDIYSNTGSHAKTVKLETPNLKQLRSLQKPFLMLAGISGTGKTRFVREQAKATGSLATNYCLAPVRPDWHEPSDLFGYISRLSGKAEYVNTDVVRFFFKAWRSLFEGGVNIEESGNEGEVRRLVVSGLRSDLEGLSPYWLCLDEMNLAPVEQYFADYLSVLETREWFWEEDAFEYKSDPLISPSVFEQMADTAKLRAELGLAESQYDELWGLFFKHGLGIPFNLIVAGTVNMDETTHGFSRKVIDRALSVDFGEFYPNNYGEFFNPASENVVFTYPIYTDGRDIDSVSPTADADGSLSIAFLDAVKNPLKGTPFEIAYRALNELLLAVMAHSPSDELTLQAVWDDFIMMKVLPRIEGDEAKLALQNPGSYPDNASDVLGALQSVLQEQLKQIWQTPTEQPAEPGSITRPDLHRNGISSATSTVAQPVQIPCRSQAKLEWMQQKLEKTTFTSFWP